MAEQQHQPANEFQGIRTAAAQTRLRAMRSQIAIGLTFCRVAESELQSGYAVNAHNVVDKLWKMTRTMRRHLNELNHVPSTEVEKVRAEMELLESRVLDLEARARQSYW